jgi:hypothetical protein
MYVPHEAELEKLEASYSIIEQTGLSTIISPVNDRVSITKVFELLSKPEKDI